MSAGTGSVQKFSLSPGMYEAHVVGIRTPGNLVEVKIKGHEAKLECLMACNIFSNWFGFKTHFLPTVGTRVLVILTGQYPAGYVFAGLPESKLDNAEGQQNFVAGDPDSNYDAMQAQASRSRATDPAFTGHKPPIDLVPGEFSLYNELGVGISLLRGLSSLQAGDLARIETHLMDDMVRIISRTFRQHSSFGDFEIYNDGGRLNAVWNGTSQDHEAWGKLRPEDPKATLNERKDGIDMDASLQGNEDGRWRFTQYLGWLGGFVSTFVTDPVATLGKLAEDQVRSGKFRLNVAADGSLLVQSIADIVLEKCVRIPVPVPIRKPDDPAGNVAGPEPMPEHLKTWVPTDNTSVFEMVYQLRDYVRWLNNAQSFGRFRQLRKDYMVPTEAKTPVPDLNSGETDRAAVNKNVTNWRLVYSTIRIYRDGSILNLDAYGNAYLSTANGIQISTPKDLLIQAGGSVNIVAGRDVNVVARKNVGISAITEKVRIKGQTGLQMFSAAGHLVYEAASGFVHKFKGVFNVNDKLGIAESGAVNVNGDFVANRLSAAVSNGAFGYAPHMGHIFIGIPRVTAVTAQFEFQSSYGATPLYETLSQQMMRVGDVFEGEVWDFSGNTVSGKGAPWPGESPSHKQANTTNADSLQTPSTRETFRATSDPMQATALQVRCQA